MHTLTDESVQMSYVIVLVRYTTFHTLVLVTELSLLFVSVSNEALINHAEMFEAIHKVKDVMLEALVNLNGGRKCMISRAT